MSGMILSVETEIDQKSIDRTTETLNKAWAKNQRILSETMKTTIVDAWADTIKTISSGKVGVINWNDSLTKVIMDSASLQSEMDANKGNYDLEKWQGLFSYIEDFYDQITLLNKVFSKVSRDDIKILSKDSLKKIQNTASDIYSSRSAVLDISGSKLNKDMEIQAEEALRKYTSPFTGRLSDISKKYKTNKEYQELMNEDINK